MRCGSRRQVHGEHPDREVFPHSHPKNCTTASRSPGIPARARMYLALTFCASSAYRFTRASVKQAQQQRSATLKDESRTATPPAATRAPQPCAKHDCIQDRHVLEAPGIGPTPCEIRPYHAGKGCTERRAARTLLSRSTPSRSRRTAERVPGQWTLGV